MDYEQLPDGTWRKKPMGPEYEPQPVRCWYMRDNHTFRALPLDVEGALAVMREERDAGHTYGMLCGRPTGVTPPVVHASTAAEWSDFEARARPWLAAAVAASKPPNSEVRGASRPAGEASSAEGATSTVVLGAERPGKE